LNNGLGKVRPERVKKIAKELIKRYPDKFTTDFEDNKRLLATVSEVPSTKLRNRIAGYVTRLVAITKAAEKAEAEEAGEVEEGEEEGET
jgi:small subunit ribosomal protein S17e